MTVGWTKKSEGKGIQKQQKESKYNRNNGK
jgi:hypothetical protein